MTLRDLLKAVRYKDVFNVIYREYCRCKPEDHIYAIDVSYRKLFGELLTLPPKKSPEYQIYLSDEEADEKRMDVGLYCAEDDQTYAMDFTPWEDLIDAKIRKRVACDDATTAGHILWEMTFYGFSRESVAEARENLDY